MDDSTKKILEIVTDIQDRMVARDDLDATRRELQAQITENTKAIAALTEQMRNVFGFAKEIDFLMTRISSIEKHVGISK